MCSLPEYFAVPLSLSDSEIKSAVSRTKEICLPVSFHCCLVTAYMVVQKAVVSQWPLKLDLAFFDAHSSETIQPIFMNLEACNYCPRTTHYAKRHFDLTM